MSAVANLPTNQQSIQSGQAEPSAQFTPSEEGSCRNPKHVIPAWSDIKERFTSIKGFHAACEVVPQIDQGMFDRLVDAIQRDGQLEKIKVDRDGLVLDGRSRLYACYILSLEPSLVSVGKLSKFRFSRLDRSISSREDQNFENAIASFDGHFHRKLRAIADR